MRFPSARIARRCGIGSRGIRCPSLADFVGGAAAIGEASKPANVAYALSKWIFLLTTPL